MLRGRTHEFALLDRLLADVSAGRSGTLVLRGDAGTGKSALLDEAVQRAPTCRVERAAGVQSEMELAFAGLHQLCAPMLDGLPRLPGPQRSALETAFGLRAGLPPDRFFIGLAFLSLVADTARERPLICAVDDPNGSTTRQPKCSRSLLGGSRTSRSASCSRRAPSASQTP
jgi:AAA ATPase domain